MSTLLIPLTLSALIGWAIFKWRGRLGARAIGIACPVGAVMGFWLGADISWYVSRLQDKGEFHDDPISIVGGAMYGLFIGAVALPLLVWLIIRRSAK